MYTNGPSEENIQRQTQTGPFQNVDISTDLKYLPPEKMLQL